MNKNRLTGFVRIIMILCSAALVAVIFVPMWRIELAAPQYPEGLIMLIYANKIGGNVDIINGLNHYIGMKTIHAVDFIEFTILPYIILFYATFAILVAIINKRKLLYAFCIFFISFGIVAMVDFWKWEYNYGHDLNPDAAIIVPGMSYQPPLIGFKQLLNFGAYSIPDIGGWIFIAVGLFTLVAVWLTIRRSRKMRVYSITTGLLVGICTAFSSCNSAPESIKYGTDNCYSCKMTISDLRFGAEITTRKGRVYKFDDSYCLLAYLKTKDLNESEISNIYITNFTGNHELLNVKKALIWQSNHLHGPMGGDLAASNGIDSIKKIKEQFPGNEIRWNEIVK